MIRFFRILIRVFFDIIYLFTHVKNDLYTFLISYYYLIFFFNEDSVKINKNLILLLKSNEINNIGKYGKLN
jgi:hypothetical protein